MDVKISVIGAKPNSDEYQGALKLKKIFQETLPESAKGEIVLHANASIYGQSVNDIDLLVMGQLQECSYNLTFTNKVRKIITDSVNITSFCTAVELKSHGIRSVHREGTEFFVKYRDERKLHSATTQSNEQKISVMNFMKGMLGFSPYVTNVIWFTEITKKELNGLLTVNSDSKPMISNTLPNDFTAADFFQRLLWQKIPQFTSGRYIFESDCTQQSIATLTKFMGDFANKKTIIGELTRKRIELITSKSINEGLSKLDDGQMNIYRGRAGTGKTIGLIQTAIKYVDEKDARVIILTYNAALVSDIKRLFALAELPDMFQESCVTINTMHAFFFKLVSISLRDGKLSYDEYIEKYDELLGELLEFLADENDAKAFLREIMGRDYYLNWDYCFIDEAQDWNDNERDLILKIFNPSHIIVADGGQQFVRKIQACDWGIIDERKNIKLKNCLRQKTNLVKFLNHYLDSIDQNEMRITSSDKMPGGKIILCGPDCSKFPIFQRELNYIKESGNIAYDMMFFVPSVMVNKYPRCFKLKEKFEENGFSIWDGTNPSMRAEIPLKGDSVRILQYDSGRGLEAWTVVCLWIDVFLNEKINYFDDRVSADALILESKEDRLKKYLLNWLMIPLTRAIDTLIITFKDRNSDIAKSFIKIADENPDYIIKEWEK